MDPDCAWKRLIGSKYGLEDHRWKTKCPKWAFVVGLCKDTMKDEKWVSENWKFDIGNGAQVRFWKDR